VSPEQLYSQEFIPNTGIGQALLQCDIVAQAPTGNSNRNCGNQLNVAKKNSPKKEKRKKEIP